jgi:transposase InsO family protein
MNANPFPNHSVTPLHHIHSDLHEMKTRTTSGYRYWVTYIDEATAYRAVVLLKHESDAFDTFRKYKAYAENVLGSKIIELQMDQGGEFVSNAFRKFCDDAGILMRYSVRNRPHQNDMAERANSTIDEHTTAMLYEANLRASFKGEAVAAYIHIWNYLPTSAGSDNSKTPHELWFKSEPDVSHFRVWGCTAYVHVQKDKRTGIALQKAFSFSKEKLWKNHGKRPCFSFVFLWKDQWQNKGFFLCVFPAGKTQWKD